MASSSRKRSSARSAAASVSPALAFFSFREPEARARLGRWLLALAMIGSGLGLGSVHTPVLAAVTIVAAAATTLLWFDAEPLEPRPAASALIAVLAFLIAFSVVQIIPIPRSLLATVVSSEAADIWEHALSPLREEGPKWVSISLDPTATGVQILRGVTYLIVFAGALQVARRQEGVVFLERAIVTASVAVAAAALVHPALGARKVFGLYEPHEWLAYDAHHLGPLLNTNHLAAYTNIGLIISFAAVLEKRDSLPRPLAIALVIVLGATVVWTISRGGTGAMVLGAVLVTVITVSTKRSRKMQRAGTLIVTFVAIAVALLLLLVIFDETRTKFLYNDTMKLGLARNALRLCSMFGFFGIGRGAFESVYPKIRTGTDYWVYTNPENVIAQWLTEWGVPIGVLAMLVIAWSLRPQTPLARSRPPLGAWAAIVAVSAHNLVDYSSEIPGVVIALTVCAAIVTGGHGGGSSSKERRRFAFFDRWSKHPRAVVYGLPALALIAVIVTLPRVGYELYNEQRSFRDLGLDRSVTKEQFHERARAAMLRHPAEPYFPFVGAVRATIARDESIMPWASRALERSPIYGRVHVLIARSLFNKNPSQARLEYRIACEQDATMCVTDEAVRLVSTYYDAMELVPEGTHGPEILARMSTVLGQRLPSTVVLLDKELSRRDPKSLDPVRRATAAVLHDIRANEPWCEGAQQRAACVAEGLAAAKRIRAAASDKCEGYALGAELRVAAGDVDAGFLELDSALDQVTDRSECARRLVQLALLTGNAMRVNATLDRLLKLGCEAHDECVANLTFAASVETNRGSPRRALALTKKAWERAPERDDLLADVAAKAEAEKLHGEALEAYTKLLARHPDDPKWAAAVAREKQAATKGVFERR